jgi:hypothetical protein
VSRSCLWHAVSEGKQSTSCFLRKATSPFFNCCASCITSLGKPWLGLTVPHTLIGFSISSSVSQTLFNSCSDTRGIPSLRMAQVGIPLYQSKGHNFHHKSACCKCSQMNFHISFEPWSRISWFFREYILENASVLANQAFPCQERFLFLQHNCSWNCLGKCQKLVEFYITCLYLFLQSYCHWSVSIAGWFETCS